jgi:hypothetical protein
LWPSQSGVWYEGGGTAGGVVCVSGRVAAWRVCEEVGGGGDGCDEGVVVGGGRGCGVGGGAAFRKGEGLPIFTGVGVWRLLL